MRLSVSGDSECERKCEVECERQCEHECERKCEAEKSQRREGGAEGVEGKGRRLGPAHAPLALFSHSRVHSRSHLCSHLCSHCSAVKHSKKSERSVSAV